MTLTSALCGAAGSILLGYGLGRIRHEHPDGWGFCFLSVVLIGLGITHGLWGT